MELHLLIFTTDVTNCAIGIVSNQVTGLVHASWSVIKEVCEFGSPGWILNKGTGCLDWIVEVTSGKDRAFD